MNSDKHHQVVTALHAVLPAHCVLCNDEDTRPYECDASPLIGAPRIALHFELALRDAWTQWVNKQSKGLA